MRFVSYAQNFEDVMLWRVLKHVERGFYIDIGAQDPVVDSVSLAFYENGWRGVHVEPTTQYSNKLRQARPDEKVEQVAVGIGNDDGFSIFYEFRDTGLSTIDPNNAQKHKQAGFSCIESIVPIISLDALFERIGQRVIHWLKIDVEGFEKSVLESWEESKARPWVLVIESTGPMTQEESYAEWEDLVLSKGYRFAYFDGLNRFYVYSEQSCLLRAFRAPPNIFDGFLFSGTASQPFNKLLEAEAQQAEAKAQQAEAVLNAVYNSRSWRITEPLRWCGHQVWLMRQHGGSSLHFKALVNKIVNKIVRPLVRLSVAFLSARSDLRIRCVALIRRYGLYDSMQSLYFRCSGQQDHRNSPSVVGQGAAANLRVDQLTPRARKIYEDLKAAIEHHQKGKR